MKALNEKRSCGIIVRSRAEWIEDGERPSRYFFKLQTIKSQKSHISSVYDSNGVEVFSQQEIEKAHVDFYTHLFSEEPIDLNAQNDLLSSLSHHLSPDQASLCEGQVTLEEITSAAKKK